MKKGIFYILLSAVLFTTFEPVSKLIANQIQPMQMTFLRFFIGAVLLSPFAIRNLIKKNITLNIKDYLVMALLGVLCICISMVLLQFAVLKSNSPALIAIIFSSNSVFTILFASLLLKDKITPQKIIAMVLCIIGVVICADFKSGTNLSSVLLVSASALSFSLYTVLSKKLMTKVTGIIQTSFSFFFGSIILLIVLLFMGENTFTSIDSNNIWILLYLSICVTGIGYWSYFSAMDKASAFAASMVFFIKPILVPFATFFINGIIPDIKVFIALILVVSGSYIATKNNMSKEIKNE